MVITGGTAAIVYIMPTKRDLSTALLSSKAMEGGIHGTSHSSTRKHLDLTQRSKISAGRRKYTPSSYMSEMSLSTEERLAKRNKDQPPPMIVEFLDMSDNSHAKDSIVDIDRPLFCPMPSEVIFQQYEAHKQYKVLLELRNVDKFARHVKVTAEDSPYFSIQASKNAGGKVAPGMEVTYTITFSPDSSKDYAHELLCITEREKFVVPIRAVGSRGVVDFPDELHFPTAPVKYVSTKTILIRNVGTEDAKFSMETTGPFSVIPSNIALEVGASMQMDINFTPHRVGDHRGQITVHYHTGEDVVIETYGGSMDANIRIDRNTVKMENTYINMSSHRSVMIHNRSDVVVHYQWKAFSSELEEMSEKDMRSAQLTAEESITKEALLEECVKEPGFRDRLSILSRTFDYRKQYVDDDRFMYSDDIILIEPLEGDVWPNSQAEISVIFKPDEATSYSRVAYCDITGRETRLPLKIKGEGLGPKLQFSFDTLDIQNVFINSGHTYEVVLENKGEVEAMYALTVPNTLFGPKFQFNPSDGILQPGGLQAIEITFYSTVLGEFCEEFILDVNKAPEPLKLVIKGKVIGPTFRFNVPCVDFGVISYGFVSSKDIMLHNTSEIPLSYILSVPSDHQTSKSQTVLSSEVSLQSDPSEPSDGPEFVIRPRKGVIPPSCAQKLQIDFTPCQVRVYDETLVVDVKGVGRNIFSLPVQARVEVPVIAVSPSVIDLEDCFLYYPYSACVKLINQSDLQSRYSLQQPTDSDVPMKYSSIANKGIIPSNDCVQIPIQFELKQSEVVDMKLPIVIAGSTDQPLEIGVRCRGHGPLVKVSPKQLSWGVCPVLTSLEKTLTVVNQSLIPAFFTCSLVSERPVYSVHPSSGSINPESSQTISVTAFVDDCLKFTDKLSIAVTDGRMFAISLSAEGTGTTIVSDPPLLPGVDLGPHFSNGPCQHQFKLTNKGRRMQALSWTTEGFSAMRKKKLDIAKTSQDKRDLGRKTIQIHSEAKVPTFKVIPDKTVLCPNQSQVITIEGKCKRERSVEERLICHSIIGRNPLKEKIMSVDVQAQFISPLIDLSNRILEFKLIQKPGMDLELHSQEVTLKNISPLNLTTLLETSFPFFVSVNDKPRSHTMDLSIEAGKVKNFYVTFESSYCSDKKSRHEENQVNIRFREHSHKDIIKLKSEVHFPNVDFDKNEVDFGCVLNDTEMSSCVTMINTSPIEVSYNWAFLKQPPFMKMDDWTKDEGVVVESEEELCVMDEQVLAGEGQEAMSAFSEQSQSPLTGEEKGEATEEEIPIKESFSPKQDAEKPENMEEQTEEEILGQLEGDPSRSLEKEGLSQTGSSPPTSPPHPVEQDGSDNENAAVQVSIGSTAELEEVKSEESSQNNQDLFERKFVPVNIQQVFDILPLSGVLLPGQTQQIQFTFYGHSCLSATAIAVCQVDGGPSYHLTLKGEASGVSHQISRTEIPLGEVLYDRVIQEEVLLKNLGGVEFEYCTFGVQNSTEPSPGSMAVWPAVGEVAPMSEQTLTVSYLPGLPEPFKVSFEIQVGHLHPQTVTLEGVGVFPSLSLSCSRYRDPDGVYESLISKLTKDLYQTDHIPAEVASVSQMASHALAPSGRPQSRQFSIQSVEVSGIPEVDSLSDLKSARPTKELECAMDQVVMMEYAKQKMEASSDLSINGSEMKTKCHLPHYDLDFGYTILGDMCKKRVILTNTSPLSVTVNVQKKAIAGSGFSVDLSDKIKSLPDGEIVDFIVKFDPASVNCHIQEVVAVLPLQIVNGPWYHLRLHSVVTLPSLQLSQSEVDFGIVQCGQCKVVTIRMTNHNHVTCQWNSVTERPAKKPPKHMPLHLKKKFKEKAPPKYFDLTPSSGKLMPGQSMDIKVKFTPAEETGYSHIIPLPVNQNPDAGYSLAVQGEGSEPQVIFSKTMLDFGPVLPYSNGDEQEVVILNPTAFPVEMYSLEFDERYLEEEKILRWLKEFRRQKTILMPPLQPGGKLPFEILDAYKESQPPEIDHIKPLSTDALLRVEEGTETGSHMDVIQETSHLSVKPSASTIKGSVPDVKGGVAEEGGSAVGELEVTPLGAAVACYMGIELSPEARLAELRRGIAIVVHGPPESGCSTQAKKLQETFNAGLLNIDSVIKENISSADSPAGVKARLACMEATAARLHAVSEDLATQQSSQDQVKKQPSKEKDKDKDLERTQEEEHQPPPTELTTFEVDPLEGSDVEVPDGQLYPTKLAEELIVEMLTERVLHQSCYHGVVFDGLESQFIQNPILALALVLKAIGDRKHIYFVNLNFTYESLQARREERLKEEERRKQEIEEEKIKAEEMRQAAEERLLALSEDEYEALDPKEKEHIEKKRHQLKKERLLKRKQEERERQEEERRALEEARRLEEEKRDKKKGRGKGGRGSIAPKALNVDHVSPGHGVASRPGSSAGRALPGMLQGVLTEAGGLQSPSHTQSKASLMGERAGDGPPDQEIGNRKKKVKKDESDSSPKIQLSLTQKWYMYYSGNASNMTQLLGDWDRSIGASRPRRQSIMDLEGDMRNTSSTPKHKSKGKKELLSSGSKSSLLTVPSAILTEKEENREGLGVPVVSVDAARESSIITCDVMSALPAPDKILNEMGLGPEGPPIMDPITFSVVKYPKERQRPQSDSLAQFTFIGTSADDPNLLSDESPPVKVPVEEDAKSDAPPEPAQQRAVSRKAPSQKSTDSTASDGASKKPKSRRERRTSKTVSPIQKTPPPEPPEPIQSETIIEVEEKVLKLKKFRWLIGPGEEKTLKLQFTSNAVGTVDQTLNFEVLGTKRCYQLFCRGHCALPDVAREPRLVFPGRQKSATEDDIIHKKFVISDSYYTFGPLLCGKLREKHKENHENRETFTIANTSPLPAEASFCLQNDHNGTTFLFDPPSMSLLPGEKKLLSVWAYPRAAKHYEDVMIACIMHNPDPFTFTIKCDGVQPDIEIDKKLIEFGKVLLRRRETRQLHLRNNTLLPVAWKLSGHDTMGDEFGFSTDSGIIAPKAEFTLNIHFRAMKPNVYKKAAKLEVSDVENILGLMNSEPIQIHAEAYDVALDVSFPRGADGGLDFQSIRVYEDLKLVCHLKNRGRYDIAYNFSLETFEGLDMAKFFTVSPTHSILYPGDKAQAVSIVFKANREITIKDQAILKCQVLDMHVSKEGEVIASIPIKLSARAVFSKYAITPVNDINFGALVLNSRRTLNLMIENKGEFDFRYSISKVNVGAFQGRHKPNLISSMVGQPKRARSRESISSTGGRASQMMKGGRRPEGSSLRSEVLTVTQRLTTGMFTLQPAFGSVQPGHVQNITVDFVGDQLGKFEDAVNIDIGDQPRSEEPIVYKLCSEVVLPSINMEDVASIFEEHRICKQLSILAHQTRLDGVGVYGEENRKFLFNSVIVGHSAKARFKLSNTNKIPCDVSLAVKPVNATSKSSKSTAEGFEVEPHKLTIQSHSHSYVTVTFKSLTMQTYLGSFEAVVVDSPVPARQRTLAFEVQGEGILPQVSILKPTLRDENGNLMLVFKRTLVGVTHCLPIVLKNDSTIAVTAVLEPDGNESFTLLPAQPHQQDGAVSRPAPVSEQLEVGQTAEVVVTFNPKSTGRHVGSVRLRIKDNQFENIPIALIGEGYQDDISVENIRALGFELPVPQQETIEDTTMLGNSLVFGDLPVGTSRQMSFTLANQSPSVVYRFQCPSIEGAEFSPSTAHLHPRTSKEVTVTLKGDKQMKLEKRKFDVSICKIVFTQPISQVPDWDDRMRSVKWVNAIETEESTTDSQSRPTSALSRPSTAPAKKKVIETEPEPSHSVIEDSEKAVPFVISGVVDYCKYQCNFKEIKFKDTLMYQTRRYSFPLKNTGSVTIRYRWECLDDALSSVSHLSLPVNEAGSIISEGGEVSPFTLDPLNGTIPPGEEAVFTLKYSPLDIRLAESVFKCQIPYLDESLEPLVLSVSGASQMPYCHFELEESDYLTSGRTEAKNTTRSRPLQSRMETTTRDVSLKVIEFNSCGIGVKQVRRFNIINPTSLTYDFTWTCEDRTTATSSSSSFKCLTSHGHITAGKKVEIAFEFIPTSLDTSESTWRFSIPSLSISTSFLLVGYAAEPAVNMDRAYLNFKAMLLGTQVKETVYMINNESTPYSFNIVESTLSSESTAKELKIEPLSGTVPPNDRVPLTISFKALREGEYNYNVQCNVKRKPTPVTLNIKAEGYSISVDVECDTEDGSTVMLTENKTAIRKIDMGTVQVNERSVRVLHILNNSRYSFEYSWSMNTHCRMLGGPDEELVCVTPTEGVVEAHQRSTCELTFNPKRPTTLKGCELLLKVKNGGLISLAMMGRAMEPMCAFSFTEHNFGYSFVSKQRSDLPPKEQKLIITNKDKKEVSIACHSPVLPHLKVFFESGVLAPGEQTEATIHFLPKEPKKYQETIWFEINGVTRKPVLIKGQGAEMKVEVANPSHKTVHLGALRVGQKTSKTVKLVNNSPMDVTCLVNILPSSQELVFQDNVLTVTPKKEITLLGGGGVCPVTVNFAPTTRLQHFTEEVLLESLGLAQPLFVVTGSCHGLEISLDSDHVPFGAVVMQSQSSRRILMYNKGDIGSKFVWDVAKCAQDFSIKPKEGYISAGMEVPFEITFHPKRVGQDIRYEDVRCTIEGGKPLSLTLTGMCIEQTPLKEVRHFTANVREKDEKQLPLPNKTNSTWLLHPVIAGEHWSGPDTLTIDPGKTGYYELTYHPLTMTSDSVKHQGSIFFPLPDGTGTLYNLLGTAEAPKPAGSVSQDIPCKTAHTEILHVKNWLRRPQRFRAVIESVRPEKLDRSVKLGGLDYIDVPALGKRDYRLNFYAYKEGTFVARVTFKNETTGEYLFYNVTFKATSPGIISTIDLSTPVRKSTSHRVTILNPLPTQVTFHTNVDVSDISMPSTFEVGAESDGLCSFEFLPLKPGDTLGKLTLSASELGVYQYELRLKAMPPAPEKPVRFMTTLGSSMTKNCKFVSFAKGRTEYACKVDATEFHVEKSVQAPSAGAGGSGTEVNLDVQFEPSHLGDTVSSLCISAPAGGDYVIPLYGHCLPPKPQGPFTIRAGSSINIPFKNVFHQSTQFVFQMDNPAFVVKANDVLKPKKTYHILIQYDAKQADPQVPKMGKLTVSCQQASNISPNIAWTYYLKGEPHDRHRGST